jgi:hypothetical protein
MPKKRIRVLLFSIFNKWPIGIAVKSERIVTGIRIVDFGWNRCALIEGVG